MANNLKRKNKNNTSTGLILIVLILIVIVLGVILIIINKFSQKQNEENEKKNQVELKVNSVTYEASKAGVNIIPTDVLTGSAEKISTAIIDTSAVVSDKVGTYEVKITCEDKSFTLPLRINDTKAPAISLVEDVYKTVSNRNITIENLVHQVDDVTTVKTGIVLPNELNDINKYLKDSVSFYEPGSYTVYVVAIDEGDNITTSPVMIEIEEIVKVDYMNSGADLVINSKTDLTTFPTEDIPFGFSSEVDKNNRPGGCTWYDNKWGKYAVDFIHPMSNNVFLTFDEGYEYGFTPKILDTLKEKNVKAVFFVTMPFVKENPDLVRRMIDEGHVVGNHSVNHPAKGVGSLPIEGQIAEVKELHDYVLENFDYEMYLFRFPEGKFTEQALAVVQSLGYRSVFWSFAHRDWYTNDQPPVADSLKNALDKVHGGEIFLLHAVSSTNTEMLGDLIDGVREKGFEFSYYYKVD